MEQWKIGPFRNYIDGKWVDASNGSRRIDENPANVRQQLAAFPSATGEDAARAIDAASKAFPGWAKTPSIKRGDFLHKAANWIDTRLAEIAEGLTREEGKTFAESKGEVARGVSILRYYAGECMQPSGEVYPSASAATLLYA